ncbi:uroporphyrinogen decarboxylase family protein [Clostridium tyrobutyricum]|uniref:uroporphyrinogen decarboxylase family protein n=1 Tax=Clostridium tyrobutyricum TaxID=1519 RepID=UPI00030CA3E9|nr:uroporphyrinogen decarboxylase family protein [Clostridium tyrobutyricum]
MDFNTDSICKGESIQQIPTEVLKKTGIYFGDAHFKKDCMAVISENIKKIDGECICRIPFCTTLEAEAFGSNVKLDKYNNQLLLNNFKYSTVEDLSNLHNFDFNRGRMREILDCISILSKRGNIVALNVEGPFTVLTMLIDSLTVFRNLIKQNDIIHNALLIIQNNIREYIIRAIEKGARIISYSDPSSDINIIGPATYRKLAGKITYDLIRSIEGYIDDCIVHICARTSLPFEKMKFCRSTTIAVGNNISYGEAICELLDNKDIKFLGHKCMNNTHKILKNSTVWKLDLI